MCLGVHLLSLMRQISQTEKWDHPMQAIAETISTSENHSVFSEMLDVKMVCLISTTGAILLMSKLEEMELILCTQP